MAYVFEDTPKQRFVFEDTPRFVFEDGVDTSDISPLPESDVSLAAPKAAAAIVGGMQAFPVSGIGGLAALTGGGPTAEDPFAPETRGSLESAGGVVEAMGSLPAKLADDKASQELTGELMKPVEMVEVAGQFYGDWVEKNWPDRDEAAEMGALTKSVFEGTVFVGLPALKVKLIKAIKAKDIPKIKEYLEGAKKTEKPIERFVFEDEKPVVEPIEESIIEPQKREKVEGMEPQGGEDGALLEFLKSEQGAVELKTPRQMIDELENSPFARETSERLGKIKQGISQGWHSPEEVYVKILLVLKYTDRLTGQSRNTIRLYIPIQMNLSMLLVKLKKNPFHLKISARHLMGKLLQKN